MYENPGDELYFGEVYRQVLQEAWLPEGGEEWMRLGKSRRGHRPTQQGIYPHSPTYDQSFIRQGFSLCSAAWRNLPSDTPNDPPCDDRKGKDYWWQQKQDRGVMCSYYDLYMRHCISFWLANSCLPPIDYRLAITPPDLKDVVCNVEYPLEFGYHCGSLTMFQGPGDFSDSTWAAPACGKDGLLAFKDGNGATGCVPYSFHPDYLCDEFLWSPSNPSSIEQDSDVTLYISGGVPPFVWSVTGTGFSLDKSQTIDRTNILYADQTACGTASVEIIDRCENEVAGWVFCTVGDWVLIFECQIGISDRKCGPTFIGKYQYEIGWRRYGGIPFTCDGLTGSCGAPALTDPGYACAGLYCKDGAVKDLLDISVRGLHLWQWQWGC